MFIFFTITLDFFSATERGSPYRDFAEIVRKPHSHSIIFTISVHKSHDAPAMSMRAPYDYLKSLRSYYYLNSCGVLTISVRCPYTDHAINLRCIYGLRACDFVQHLSECGVNKIVEATMPVNPYNDDWVSLR